ncbi:DUF2920 family protein [Campylobacter jejuni]|uniref:DUF2920 family protein n=1 Tax=Campylobacter jejuni TaxID=197 RepID=UPI0011A3344F|nr:DUF2920 family protein [Campylobacter jejuni]
MLINQTFEIDSCDDEELGIGRISKLEYRVSYDDEKDIKAIVFMVGGFGSNQNISFLDFDREYIAKKFDVVAVNVFYHCFCHRQSTESKYSASVIMQDKDIRKLKFAFDHFRINFEYNGRNIKDSLECLDDAIQTLKNQNKINQDFKLSLTGTLEPPNGDYQNYGIMAAIDHINALKDLVKRFPKFGALPKIYGGGSYGGYLSLLMAKIAPWYVDGVIDNSGTVLPFLTSIIGGDINAGDFVFRTKNIDLFCSTISHWTRIDDTSPYFFGNENYMIRALLNSSHLQIQAKKNNNIIFVGYHSVKDEFKTSKDKETLFEIYKALSYDATLHLIKDENEIDGKFIKDLKHGMRIGNKALFKKELPLMLEKLQGRESFMQENTISYPCGQQIFIFEDDKDKFTLMIT